MNPPITPQELASFLTAKDQLAPDRQAWIEARLNPPADQSDALDLLDIKTPGRELPWLSIVDENWPEAIRILTKELTRDNDRSELFAYRALARMNNGESLEEVEQDAMAATRCRDNTSFAWQVLGRVYLKWEDYDSARENLEIARSHDAENPCHLKFLAMTYYYPGNCTKALELINQSIEIHDSDPDAYLKRSAILLGHAAAGGEQGYYANAIEDCEIAILLKPDKTTHSACLFNQAVANCRLGNFKDAIGLLNESLTYDPTDSNKIAKLGYCHYRNGNLGDAKKLFDRIDKSGVNSEFLGFLSTCMAEIEKALQTDAVPELPLSAQHDSAQLLEEELADSQLSEEEPVDCDFSGEEHAESAERSVESASSAQQNRRGGISETPEKLMHSLVGMD